MLTVYEFAQIIRYMFGIKFATERVINELNSKSMRKFFIALVAVAATLGASAAEADDTPIEAKALPAAAHKFLKHAFPNCEISYATKDVDFMDVEYKVALASGYVVEFNSKGAWKDIDGHGKALPEAVIPTAISHTIQKRFPGHVITDLSLDRGNYEVKLDNGLEVELNSAGKILEIDD